MSKPSLPQGTRDFGPDTVRKRNYILNTIKHVFELYGFQPLETPAMENIETLMGKYGEEGDKLIFRILESGDSFSAGFFNKLGAYLKQKFDLVNYYKENVSGFENAQNPFANPLWNFNPEVLESFSNEIITEEFKEKNKQIKAKNLPLFKQEVSGKALKYDLTIPFARYVAMNFGQLTMPFKRYQIQPVWRADRPQKGRYREFYQCDADVVGSNSLLNEVELAMLYFYVFEKLGLEVEIKINSRKILTGIAEVIEEPERIVDITVAIDKVDKIGIDGVKEELRKQGFAEKKIKLLNDLIFSEADKILYFEEPIKEDYNLTKLNFLKNGSEYRQSEILQKGVDELDYIINRTNSLGISNLKIDLSLARGLNYYTGIIFEVKAKDVQIGSIGGGGRYDDLTGLFGVPNIPGVGISFGVDRIYDVMEELKLFPEDVHTGTQVLFFNLGDAENKAAFKLMQQLRNKNTRCELYHETSKFDKQFRYAEKKNIPYIIIIGSKELEEKNCVVKNLRTSEQQTISIDSLLKFSFN